MSKIQLLKALVWIIQFWCGTASWKLIWFLLGYPSTKNLRFRNRSGTSGNAMEIFSICGRVAALGYTYFWVLCVCLSIFLASVLVRVLHPCVAHELWKLLRGCNCCALIWWTHLTDGMLFVCLCTLLLWSGCGKHLTGSLVLPFTAAVWMKVECIPQAICSCTCVWKLEREKHLRITQCGFYTRTTSTFYIYSMWNVHSQNSSWNQSLPCLALILHVWLSFRFRSGCRSGRPRNSSRRWCASWLALLTFIANVAMLAWSHKFWGKQKSSRSGWENAIRLSLFFLFTSKYCIICITFWDTIFAVPSPFRKDCLASSTRCLPGFQVTTVRLRD